MKENKKIIMLFAALALSFVFIACGSNISAETINVGDISFQVPDGYEMEKNDSGYAEYYTDTFLFGVYFTTEEEVTSYDYDPPPASLEELRDCFIDQNPEVTGKEKTEIGGQEAYIVTYNDDDIEAFLLYKDKLYTVALWNASGLNEELEADFQALLDSIKLN